jgi:hypothetical protein
MLGGCASTEPPKPNLDLPGFEWPLQPPKTEADLPLYLAWDDTLRERVVSVEPRNFFQELDSALSIAAKAGRTPTIYLGLVSTEQRDSPPLVLLTPHDAPDRPTRTEESYSVVGFRLASGECLETVPEPDIGALKVKAKQGGICASLAVAHSLLRRQVVRREWEGVVVKKKVGERERLEWNPEFLKRVYRASGDADNNREITSDQTRRAHTASWNTLWRFRESAPREKIISPGDKPSRGELRAWCNKLKRYLEDKNDDCFINTRGAETTIQNGATITKAIGHLLPVTKIQWSSGRCKIDAIDTGIQDEGVTFASVPFDPGQETWEVTTADVRVADWGSIVWNECALWCFDEEPTRSGVKETDKGEPGMEFRDE